MSPNLSLQLNEFPNLLGVEHAMSGHWVQQLEKHFYELRCSKVDLCMNTSPFSEMMV